MASAGIVCFLSNVGFAGFIKFQPYKTAAVVLCATLAPGLAYCTVQHFRWMGHLLSSRLARPLVSFGAMLTLVYAAKGTNPAAGSTCIIVCKRAVCFSFRACELNISAMLALR